MINCICTSLLHDVLKVTFPSELQKVCCWFWYCFKEVGCNTFIGRTLKLLVDLGIQLVEVKYMFCITNVPSLRNHLKGPSLMDGELAKVFNLRLSA